MLILGQRTTKLPFKLEPAELITVFHHTTNSCGSFPSEVKVAQQDANPLALSIIVQTRKYRTNKK